MTFHQVGNTIVTDVNKEEEVISKFRVSIAIGDNDGKPRITAMQKGKAGTINATAMQDVLKEAEDTWAELFPKIKKYAFN
jgi:exosome complex RNA-binding protein Rrp42 (RNase PH superfamily)